MQKLDPNFSCQGSIGKFIGLYIQSEVFAKKLQRYYRTDVKNTGGVDLHVSTVKAAIKHFNISFPENDIGVLFKGGKGIKGKKCARQLRNGYLHSLSQEDKKEIINKDKTYISKLQKFLLLRI